jgi:predicted nucleic acid-binding protein
MKKYLLDTDIITYLEEKDSPFHASVKSRLSSLSDVDEVYISVLTLYEMHYGIASQKYKPYGKKYKPFAHEQSPMSFQVAASRFPIIVHLDKNRIVLYHRFFDIFLKGGNKA